MSRDKRTPMMITVDRIRLINDQLRHPAATNSDTRYAFKAERDRLDRQVDRVVGMLDQAYFGGSANLPVAVAEETLR